MKHRITAALERFSRAMLAPLSYLSAAGLLLVVGALLTSAPLAGVLPFLRWEPVQLAGRIIYKCLTAVISNLSVLFCTGLAAALAKREKHQAAFIALMSYLVYLTAGNVTLTELGLLAQPDALTGLYSAGQTMVLGIQTVDTGVFGGILLGAGGLTRAYTKTAKMALDAAGIARRCVWDCVDISCSYAFLERARLELAAQSGEELNAEYGAAVLLHACLPQEKTAALAARLRELSAGTVTPVKTGNIYRAERVEK